MAVRKCERGHSFSIFIVDYLPAESIQSYSMRADHQNVGYNNMTSYFMVDGGVARTCLSFVCMKFLQE